MAKPKTAAELKAEIEFLKKGQFAVGVVSVINTFIKYGSFTLVVRYLYLAVATLAGKETVSNIVLSLVTNLSMNQWMAYAMAGSGVAYGYSQRRLRMNTVERLQSRNEQLELAVDPNRTSSLLRSNGETRPEDKR